MEALIVFVALISVYFFIRRGLQAAARQARREEFLREVLKEVARKRKIDELYGRVSVSVRSPDDKNKDNKYD